MRLVTFSTRCAEGAHPRKAEVAHRARAEEVIDFLDLERAVLADDSVVMRLMFERERRRQQVLGADTPAASGDLSRSVDYSAIYEQVRFLARHGRWRDHSDR